jgi:hypothetical protein
VFDLAEPDRLRLPAWMRIQGIAELKHTLVQVIVYLIVDFATDVSEPETRLSWDTLVLPTSILLLAGALALMSRGGLREGAPRHRFQAARPALPVGPQRGMAEDQEPGF